MRWEEVISSAKTTLETLIATSHIMIKEAFNEAKECAHGCGCQFIAASYESLVWEIDHRREEINELEIDITGWWIELDEINTGACDFNDIIDKYELQWDEEEKRHQEDLAVYGADYWMTDDWNMDEVVDNDKFRDLYGFDYEASEYDQFLEEYSEVSTEY